MTRGTVVTALSGGVDSSVAALLLQKEGWDVIGVFLRNGVETPRSACSLKQGCCSAEDALDASQVADRLGIPFHSVDMEVEFTRIQKEFRDAYSKGHTPNPCASCNRDIKFGALANLADAMGADRLATGHYARLEQGPDGMQLFRGVDRKKDQSYVLFPVAPEVLDKCLLPIGNLQKSQVRKIAEEAELPVFSKPDSQEICFVPSGDYRDYLEKNGGLGVPGRIIGPEGEELARHSGHMGFTRGQRRGLGFASTRPMYVIDIDPDSGDVFVGPRQDTGSAWAEVDGFQTFGESDTDRPLSGEAEVQFRSAPGGTPAMVEQTNPSAVRVQFLGSAESVNPGQGLAVYRGDRLVGGGWIRKAGHAVPFPA